MARSGRGRRSRSAAFKARVVGDAMREANTISAAAAKHGVHPSQVKQWRGRFEEAGQATLRRGAKPRNGQAEVINALHAKIGELRMEKNFFIVRWGDEPRTAAGLGLQG